VPDGIPTRPRVLTATPTASRPGGASVRGWGGGWPCHPKRGTGPTLRSRDAFALSRWQLEERTTWRGVWSSSRAISRDSSSA
jgi:hypothetical protein